MNPDAVEFVPVSPSRFMTDLDPVTSSSPTPGDEKSLDGGALPSSVEFNLDIAHGPGQLDSRLGKVEEVVVAESGEEEELKEEAEEWSAHATPVSYTHLDVYKRQTLKVTFYF